MSKRESQYIEGLDKEEQNIINSLSVPWQRSFLTRFYQKLQEKNLSKRELCIQVNNQRRKLTSEEFELTPSALTQYTALKKTGRKRPPSVDALISISTALNVSIDYLLGIESSEQHDITDIHQETGLSSAAIATLKSNRNAQLFIDELLQSNCLNSLLQQIQQLYIADYVSNDILSAYSTSLTEIIISSFREYMRNENPLDYCSERYQEYLIQQFDKLGIIVNENYITANVSDDRLNQIRLIAENKHENMSLIFFTDTVDCVYQILNHRITGSNYIRSQLSNTFLEFLDTYLSEKAHNLSYHLKGSASSISKKRK